LSKYINMGNLCLWCRKDTSFGSGLFVNRTPAWNDKNEEGYKCVECEIETIKECYLECIECGQYTCEGNNECMDCGSENLKEITQVNI
jgi:hypothetical protein